MIPSGFPGSSCKLVRFAELSCRACGKLNKGVADKEQFHSSGTRFQLCWNPTNLEFRGFVYNNTYKSRWKI